MRDTFKTIIDILKDTFKAFSADNGSRLAAALAYYTIFSLPPLLVLIILLAGAVLEPQQIEGQVETQIRSLAGPEAAEQVRTMIREAGASASRSGVIGTILGLAALIFGATGAFVQLQTALNTAWNVKANPKGNLLQLVTKRLLSLGMVGTIAFLLLVSLVISALLSSLGDTLATYLPGGVGRPLLEVVNFGLSFAVSTVLFASIFKVLPDAKIAWRDVWVGAAVTALLFTIGKFLIGLYLGQSNPGSAFGAAGSLALILVWIYYSAIILLLGAEFTEVWTLRYGTRIEPSKHAVRIERHTSSEDEAPAGASEHVDR